MSTSTARETLTGYVDAMQGEDYLGLVVVYSVSEVNHPYAQLEADLAAAGLSSHIPSKPSAPDIFRRTSKALQKNRLPTADDDVLVNIMVRDVADDDDEIVRRLVCEVVDKGSRQLGYGEVYEFTFVKENRKLGRLAGLTVRRIGVSPHPIADELADGLVQEYNRLTGTVNADGIRRIITNVLAGAHAVSLRPGGGCSFADRSEAGTIAALEQFAGHIEGTVVHAIPLVDDPKQRQNLLEAVEDQSKVAIEREITEIRDVLASGRPASARVVATFAGRYREIEERASRYADLLETTLGSTRSALYVLKAQMAQLAGVAPVALPPAQQAA